MLESFNEQSDYRSTHKQENVRGRRLALETTALMSPPMHRRTAFNRQVSWLFREKTRVLRRSGVIDSRLLTIRLRSEEDECRLYIQRSPAQCTRLVPLWEIRILRDLFYSPNAQACKHFFLAEVVYESIGRFDDTNRAEAAVAYHKDDEA